MKRPASLLVTILVALSTLIAAEASAFEPVSKKEAEHACNFFIDCDCNGIRVGVLTGEWRKSCRSCQAQKRARCVERFMATQGRLGAGLKEAGYCNACTTYGPNAKPLKPPRTPAAEKSDKTPKAAHLFACPKGHVRYVKRNGGRLVTGCRDKTGRADGLWRVVNDAGETIIEILYANGRIVWQRVHSEK